MDEVATKELLALGLVNHALSFGLGYDVAWPLVEKLLDDPAMAGQDVRQLANAVREQAVAIAWRM